MSRHSISTYATWAAALAYHEHYGVNPLHPPLLASFTLSASQLQRMSGTNIP